MRILLYICAVILAVSPIYAITILVPADYPTIQEAVDNASSGDDIIVSPGVYGSVVIEDFTDLSITGAGFIAPFITTIDGGDSSRGVLIDSCTKVIIQGLEIRNCWEECINILHSNSIFILRNYLHDCNYFFGDGIHFSQCSDCLVKYNIIVDNCYSGIYLNAYPAPPQSQCVNISIINNNIAYNYMVDGLIIAYDDSGFVFKNNICVCNDERGVNFKLFTQVNAILTYNDVWANGWSNWYQCTPGVGCISLDPLFTGGTGAEAYYLQPNSPCIDAGDPTMFDPDSTRSDIGALYYDQGPGLDGLEIDVLPDGPTVLPPQGGMIYYLVQITNQSPIAQTFDAWLKLYLPNGQAIDPMLIREGLNLPSGGSINRHMDLEVPMLAASGLYILSGYVGLHPFNIEDSSAFGFEKLPFNNYPGGSAQWMVSGWGETEAFETCTAPDIYELSLSASPNPFNPQTTISFDLPSGGEISLKIFDSLGREVEALGNGHWSSGKHNIVWNAGDRASGLYFVQLSQNGCIAVDKILLVK